jgi:exosortase F-associated protein
MNKKKYIFAGLLLLGLVFIRLFEKSLFNDGLIHFFELDYSTQHLPKKILKQLIITDTVRFWLNSALSIGIMILLFKQKHLLQRQSVYYGL